MKTEKKEIQTQVNLKDLPNLHKVEVSQRELASEYWTPTEEGEYKVGVIIDIKEEEYIDKESGESVMLQCVIMIAQKEDQSFSTIRNGSVRLVKTIEKAVESGDIEMGTVPVKITFMGNQKNKTNAFKSDRWSVKPLIV